MIPPPPHSSFFSCSLDISRSGFLSLPVPPALPFSFSLIVPCLRLGVLDLPTWGTHPLPCHYVVISDNERVSANSLSYAYLRSDTGMGREASLARNLTANSTSESLVALTRSNILHGACNYLSICSFRKSCNL